MSHAIQLSAQRQVNHYAHKLGGYEWFDDSNKFKALEALEGYAYAAFNNIPNLPAQYKKQAMSVFNKDKAEKAVHIGQKLGMPTKIFAVHEGSMVKPFAIKSSKFDWKVLPIEISEQPVPEFVMRNLMAFRQAGTVFEKFCVAVPGNPNFYPASIALKKETFRVLHEVKLIGRKVVKTLYDETVNASRAMVDMVDFVARSAAANKRAMEAFMKDPVFLGSYGEGPVYLVEIGRWI